MRLSSAQSLSEGELKYDHILCWQYKLMAFTQAAMAEGLADKGRSPGTQILRVYGEWAKGGWGVIFTGMKTLNDSR